MRDFEGDWAPSDVQGDTMVCRFYTKPVVDKVATAAARQRDPNAFPVYMEAPFIRMQSAGDAKTVWDKPVDDEHKHRFGRAWQAFERGAINEIVGTPLAEWARIPRSMVMGLQQQGILSVEDVANIPDNQLAILGEEGDRLRQAARSFLEPADQNMARLEKENGELRAEIEQLKATVEQMLHMPAVEDAEPAKRGPGRPRKAA